jgi:phage N-6-adenine-methyltransferase
MTNEERGIELGKLRSKAIHFSRESDLWETPDDVFQALHEEFDFKVDGAATEETSKLPVWYGPGSSIDSDALHASWEGPVFLNPPYSQCYAFVEKAYTECVINRVTTVILLPARTDTKWFHNFIWDKHKNKPYDFDHFKVEVRFLKGRLKFKLPGKKANSAPFPSMVVIFRPKEKPKEIDITWESIKHFTPEGFIIYED